MAQNLFEQIFGFGAPKPPAAVARVQPSKPIAGAPTGFKDRVRLSDLEPASSSTQGGTFRTVCVRMCDGAFVPISFATRRDNFVHDQGKCRATCGDDARLFFHNNPGGSIEDAVDMSGRAYGRLPNAFRFRKTRVEGCSCRPPPWSEAELARHQSYAAAAVPMPSTTPQFQTPKVAVADVPARAQSVEATAAEPKKTPKAPKQSEVAIAEPVVAEVGAAKAPRRIKTPFKIADLKTPPQRIVRAPTPPKAQVAAQTAGSGFFGIGSGSSSGLGLGPKPKLQWPGD